VQSVRTFGIELALKVEAAEQASPSNKEIQAMTELSVSYQKPG
jgi:hypothetical protein